MRLTRLADLWTVKYNLQSQAATLEDIVNQVKRNLINAYTLYVNADKAKEPILQMLADAGEPFSKSLVRSMEEIVAGIDTLSLVQLFNRVNAILDSINVMKKTPEVRDFIHNSVRARTEAERNHRERIKSKLEMVISRISGILEKEARVLRKFLPKEVPLAGGVVEPQRMQLSKEKLLMFMRTPAAQRYGLDNIDVVTRLLSYPELREKITTLINSVDRGFYPLDGPEVAAEAAEIKRIYDERQKTNVPFLESEAPSLEKLEEEKG